jgi:hypothetical protein
VWGGGDVARCADFFPGGMDAPKCEPANGRRCSNDPNAGTCHNNYVFIYTPVEMRDMRENCPETCTPCSPSPPPAPVEEVVQPGVCDEMCAMGATMGDYGAYSNGADAGTEYICSRPAFLDYCGDCTVCGGWLGFGQGNVDGSITLPKCDAVCSPDAAQTACTRPAFLAFCQDCAFCAPFGYDGTLMPGDGPVSPTKETMHNFVQEVKKVGVKNMMKKSATHATKKMAKTTTKSSAHKQGTLDARLDKLDQKLTAKKK